MHNSWVYCKGQRKILDDCVNEHINLVVLNPVPGPPGGARSRIENHYISPGDLLKPGWAILSTKAL